AIWKDGRPTVLRPHGRSALVPSVIHFPEQGAPIVGREARDHAIVDPRNTLFSIKRFMGRGLADVKAELARLPYVASENERGLIQLEARGKRSSPEQLSGLILTKVHEVASAALGERAPTKCVVTVPA